MAEGGFDYGLNMSGSESESEPEDDRMAREVREGLVLLRLDAEDEEVEGESKNEVAIAQLNEGVGTDDIGQSSRPSQSLGSTSDLRSNQRRDRSRSFSFSRLVRRLSNRRTGSSINANTEGGRPRMQHGFHHAEAQQQDGDEPHYSTADVVRPRSVLLRPRSRTEGETMARARRRRSSGFFDRVRKFWATGTGDGDSETGDSMEALEGSSSSVAADRSLNMFTAESPIRFPIGVNELVAIRRERARLRAEQTRIEHHIIKDLQEITNCPWYWGKINRFEAERVLEGHPDGTFLLRDSAQYHYLFSVSFRRYFRTYHARIEQWKHRYSFDKPSDYSFCSRTVSELLEHYSQAEHCMYYEPLLLNSLPRKQTLPLQHLCRAVISSHVSFQSIDELPIPKSLKLFMRDYHYKVAVKIMEDKGTQTAAPKRKFLSRS